MTTHTVILSEKSDIELVEMLGGAISYAAQTIVRNELIERLKKRKKNQQNEPMVKNPLGWQAGAIDPAWQVFWNISIEMMGHRSDLQEDAIRMQRNSIDSPKMLMTDAVEILEKYAVAVTIR
jgi:DNA-binding response OmpR family regulator